LVQPARPTAALDQILVDHNFHSCHSCAIVQLSPKICPPHANRNQNYEFHILTAAGHFALRVTASNRELNCRQGSLRRCERGWQGCGKADKADVGIVEGGEGGVGGEGDGVG
jgi:hypothetical protein